jgi:hypothetical protein
MWKSAVNEIAVQDLSDIRQFIDETARLLFHNFEDYPSACSRLEYARRQVVASLKTASAWSGSSPTHTASESPTY